MNDDELKELKSLNIENESISTRKKSKARTQNPLDATNDATNSSTSIQPGGHKEVVAFDIIYKGTEKPSKDGSDTVSAGLTPKAGDVVKIHYKIAVDNDSNDHNPKADDLNDANIVEDSRDRSITPFSFILKGSSTSTVIRGFEIVLIQMHKGEVAIARIPSFLAYGEDGFGQCSSNNESTSWSIPPNANLVCRIELIDFYKYDAPFRPWIVNTEKNGTVKFDL